MAEGVALHGLSGSAAAGTAAAVTAPAHPGRAATAAGSSHAGTGVGTAAAGGPGVPAASGRAGGETGIVAAAASASPSSATASADGVAPPLASATDDGNAARRVLVSIRRRRLWLVQGKDTLLAAPVAIGMGKDFSYGDRKYHFSTPRGTRRVIAKAKDPVWVVPEWHYFEKASKMGLSEVVKLEKNTRILLADSSWLVVRGDTVGRINHFGYFAPLTPGTEIVFDGRMYVPPATSIQRRVPDALGPYKLDMGDGYLIHGTHLYNEESIGEAVSHGCVRMRNEDLARLYPLVPRGTTVIIF
jgi:lipoprotein-anchoring transpeptidase ErfK/SrfK